MPAPKKPQRKTNAARAAQAEAVPVVDPTPINGTDLAISVSEAPNTRINLDLDVPSLVAVGVVYAEKKLIPILKQAVAESHRLGAEVQSRGAELTAVYNAAPFDTEFEQKCQNLIDVAAELGIRFTLEMTKGNFNPDTLKYNVTARFRGEPVVIRDYVLDDDRAMSLRSETVSLRTEQKIQLQAADDTRRKLSVGYLEKHMKASIGENAMRQTERGADMLQALYGSIDRELGEMAVLLPRQLERD